MLKLVAEGYSNTRIAEAMQVSEKRVRTVLTNVYTKLDIHESKDVNVRIAAINKARDLGLLSYDP